MSKANLIQEALCTVAEISNSPNMYMVGILLNDFDTKNHIKMLAHMQAIIMQSVQVNNPKRALKYIVAYNRLWESNTSLAERLRSSITDKVCTPLNNQK